MTYPNANQSVIFYFVRLALTLTLTFTAFVGLIHAQPYDNREVRAFLLPPEDCRAPCFMGIRPGVTTLFQARALLESHDWVSDVRVRSNFTAPGNGPRPVQVIWDWSGRQPSWINDHVTGLLRVDSNTNTVSSLSVPTRIPLAHVWLLLGRPPQALEFSFAQFDGTMTLENIYLEQSFSTNVNFSCPLRLQNYLHQPVRLVVLAPQRLQDLLSFAASLNDADGLVCRPE